MSVGRSDGDRHDLDDLAVRESIGRLHHHRVLGGDALDALDLDDARAKQIRFARRRGTIAPMEGLAVLGELETKIGEKLGCTRVHALHGTLLELLGLLERREL